MLKPEHTIHPDIDLYRDIIPPIVDDLALIDGVRVPQNVAFCPPDFYWDRFLKKAQRDGFDPQPWIWSEGDIDTTSLGKVFCVKLGAEFENESERRRFVAHELDHPRVSSQTGCLRKLLSDSEGIVEADARIALGIQSNADMAKSTQFITEMSADRLVPAAEINRAGYDHPSFYGRKPSESEGYASSLLWFVGLSLEAAHQPDAPLKDQYIAGRSRLMEVAKISQTPEEYKTGLAKIGIQYDSLSETNEVLVSTQAIIANYF